MHHYSCWRCCCLHASSTTTTTVTTFSLSSSSSLFVVVLFLFIVDTCTIPEVVVCFFHPFSCSCWWQRCLICAFVVAASPAIVLTPVQRIMCFMNSNTLLVPIINTTISPITNSSTVWLLLLLPSFLPSFSNSTIIIIPFKWMRSACTHCTSSSYSRQWWRQRWQ